MQIKSQVQEEAENPELANAEENEMIDINEVELADDENKEFDHFLPDEYFREF